MTAVVASYYPTLWLKLDQNNLSDGAKLRNAGTGYAGKPWFCHSNAITPQEEGLVPHSYGSAHFDGVAGSVPASFLMNFEIDDGDLTYITDNSIYAASGKATLPGTTPTITGGGLTYAKFGDRAMYTGAVYWPATGPEFDFSSRRWSADLWLKQLSQSNSTVFRIGADQTYPDYEIAKNAIRLVYLSAGDKLYFEITMSDGTVYYLGGWDGYLWEDYLTFSTNWTHFAVCQDGDTLYAFMNGVKASGGLGEVDVTGKTVNHPDNQLIVVGGLAPGWTDHQAGGTKHFDALRITKEPLFTANFTPPTVAPDQYSSYPIVERVNPYFAVNHASENGCELAGAVTRNGAAMFGCFVTFDELATDGSVYTLFSSTTADDVGFDVNLRYATGAWKIDMKVGGTTINGPDSIAPTPGQAVFIGYFYWYDGTHRFRRVLDGSVSDLVSDALNPSYVGTLRTNVHIIGNKYDGSSVPMVAGIDEVLFFKAGNTITDDLWPPIYDSYFWFDVTVTPFEPTEVNQLRIGQREFDPGCLTLESLNITTEFDSAPACLDFESEDTECLFTSPEFPTFSSCGPCAMPVTNL